MLIDRRGFNQAMRGLDRWVEAGHFSRVPGRSTPTWMRLLEDGTSLAVGVQRNKWNSSELGGEFRVNYTRAVKPLGLLTRAESNDNFNFTWFGAILSIAEKRVVVDITNSPIARLTVPADVTEGARPGDDLALDLVTRFFTPMVVEEFDRYDSWFRYLVAEDLERWVAFIGPRLLGDLEAQLGFPLTLHP